MLILAKKQIKRNKCRLKALLKVFLIKNLTVLDFQKTEFVVNFLGIKHKKRNLLRFLFFYLRFYD
jgi:hypothetical protein